MIRRHLIAGLLFWVPLLVTVVTIQFLWNIFSSVMVYVPESLNPEFYLGVDLPGSEVLLVLFLLWFTGVLVANFIGKRVMRVWERILTKIPLVRTVYQGVKQGLEIVVAPNSHAFSEVVLVPFPNNTSWAVALVTQKDLENGLWTVFLPTTPNPTSGYVLLIPEQDVKKVAMSVDEALKYIISLGTISQDELGMLITNNREE
ncbi:DUF502 domain-containing protein [Candidatus Comchoanobacter bicostacola]|uniref:DUF502 domain-containing protein n=1 Tax=Candidatus Comchoanobacter bicostacola TaxID=2919598 RepID=A0ABY5DKC8_9GAMM|nr:DUF502 domain-containing protein [Candidatus Comchoanobacter bicostacola]UTC24443.1 DUF502 domain-containing protein [Candidatus Comchoanobacter bicostacola]